MPQNFKYREVFLKGRPRHEKYDSFWRKHPPMSPSRWAKIFSPFDALEGFDEEISSKLVPYCEKRHLSDEEKEAVSERLSALHSLAYNSRVARLNRPQATVEYFVPCEDPNSEWYGYGGQYRAVTGTVSRVDTVVSQAIVIDDQAIPLKDISGIILSGEIKHQMPVGIL